MSLIAGSVRRALERLVSKAFALDEDSRLELRQVEETYLVLDVGGPSANPRVRTMVRIHDGVIELGSGDAVVPDVTVSGSLPAVLRYLTSWFQHDSSTAPSSGEGVTVTGDVVRLERIVAICSRLDPDWEEPVSRLLGDVPARHLGTFAREFRKWTSSARERARSATSEYVHYESGTVPSREEWAAHTRDLTRLRARLDKARTRLDERLRVKRSSGSSPDPQSGGPRSNETPSADEGSTC